MKVEFFEPMRIPRTTHNALVVRSRKTGAGKRASFVGKAERLQEAEQTWEAHLGRHTPPKPLRGPLELHLTFVFYREGIPAGRFEPMIVKPDLDNMQKTVQDAMERLGWFDVGDQQIFAGCTVKYWGWAEGVKVELWELGEKW